MHQITRRHARTLGAAAILVVAAMQAFNSFFCYRNDLWTYLGGLVFIAVPMAPALIALFTKNPLRSVGGALLFAPWLVFAYCVDCMRPYSGGGASMVYIAVLMGGLPSCLLGVLLAGPLAYLLGMRVVDGDGLSQ